MTDEQMDSMRQNMELLQGMMRDMITHVDKLADTVDRHEREWQRFRRAMRAGFDAWLNGGDE